MIFIKNEDKNINVFQKPIISISKHKDKIFVFSFKDKFKTKYESKEIDNLLLDFEPSYKFLLKNGYVEKMSNDKLNYCETNNHERTTTKLNKAIEEYDAEYGILVIDNLSNIEIKNNIIYIPLPLFSLI